MDNELRDFIGMVKPDPQLWVLVDTIFSDKEIYDKFSSCPASRNNHHAYTGGLLKHTLEVARYAFSIAITSGDNRTIPLIIAGALLHDIGKIEEGEYVGVPPVWQRTTPGNLLGHMVLGPELIQRKVGSIPLELWHIIASHHGKREWGAIQPPRSPEAYIVHTADMLSARLDMGNFSE